MTIQLLAVEDFDAFVPYVREHLADNGQPGVGYFQPQSREAEPFPDARVEAFRKELSAAVGEDHWRRLWVMRDDAGALCGHVDLRAHPERYARHRCLLGIGVDRRRRGTGYGRQLLEHAIRWASGPTGLDWIDLHVLVANLAAIRLYERAGFVRVGETVDMYRIDGVSLASLAMTRRVERRENAD